MFVILVNAIDEKTNIINIDCQFQVLENMNSQIYSLTNTEHLWDLIIYLSC